MGNMNVDRLQVRCAVPSDYEQVLRLYGDVAAHSRGTEHDVCWELGKRPGYEDLQAAIAHGDMLLAELPGFDGLAGACVIDCNAAKGYEDVPWELSCAEGEAFCLHLFCIHPELAGKGLGSAFLARVEDEARRRGARSIRLDVLPNNVPAQRLYLRCGYRDHGFHHLFYGEGLLTDFYLMEKVL